MCKMAETENTDALENCEIKLECTENSHPFEVSFISENYSATYIHHRCIADAHLNDRTRK